VYASTISRKSFWDLERRALRAVVHRNPRAQGRVVRDVTDRPHRIAEGEVLRDGAVLDHREQQRGHAVAEIDRVLRHVRVADDHVEPAVFLAIGMRLVAGVHDRPLHHRVESDLGLEEIRALGDLVGAGVSTILAADLARPTPDLARREERQQGLDDLLERRASIHQVVLVAAVAVALAVAVVLVDQHLRAFGQQRVRLATAHLHDPLAGLLVDDDVARVRHLGARILGVGMIDVVPGSVDQRLVAGDVLLLVGRVLLALDLESARVGERILLIVVPEDPALGILAIGVDDQHAGRDGIEIRVVLDRDARTRSRFP
jgi:hypothetical protein